MEISVNDLVERVKINMEELTDVSNASVKLEVGIDVEQYIRAKLPDALLSVWASTPVELLPQTDCASSLQPERQPDGSGRVVLPSDVWRMTEFCMEGWRQPVTSFIDHTSPAYELQFNLYTRGGVATPVFRSASTPVTVVVPMSMAQATSGVSSSAGTTSSTWNVPSVSVPVTLTLKLLSRSAAASFFTT